VENVGGFSAIEISHVKHTKL